MPTVTQTTDHYWHWLGADRRVARYIDRGIARPHCGTEVVAGQTLRVDGTPVPCKSGLHASARVLDALIYAPGPVVTLVTLGGAVVRDGDKSAAQERTCLWIHDATDILHEFAWWCASAALTAEETAGRPVDARCWAAISAKRGWLRGEVSDEQLDAARDAAWDAARDAAWDAARSAARDAARSAAWDAARSAAWDAAISAAWAAASDAAWAAASDAAISAAWAAARDAAWAAARDAAWAAASDAARDAAWDAARSAAWDAAISAARDAAWAATRDAQNAQLTRMMVAAGAPLPAAPDESGTVIMESGTVIMEAA